MNSLAAHGNAGSHYVIGQYYRCGRPENVFPSRVLYLASLVVTVLVTLYDSFPSLRAQGMNCWGVLHRGAEYVAAWQPGCQALFFWQALFYELMSTLLFYSLVNRV